MFFLQRKNIFVYKKFPKKFSNLDGSTVHLYIRRVTESAINRLVLNIDSKLSPLRPPC